MKNTSTILLLGLLLCGCSQKQAVPAGAAIDLVQAGKDTSWRDGYVLHVTKRDGPALQGVTIAAKLPTGQTQTISADTATLSPLPNATDGSSVMLTLHNAKTQTGSESAALGDFPISLHK
jgi:hypothetical protein